MKNFFKNNYNKNCVSKFKNNSNIPIILEKTNKGDYSYDLYSKLLKERIIFLSGEITDEISNSIIAQLLYLEGEDQNGDINFYINSNGGNISSGMAIYDTMNYIKCKISTICIGLAASMGAFLLSSGKKGKRYSLPNSRIMIHQPLGGAQGQASDIIIQAKEILYLKKTLNNILAYNTNQSVEKIIIDTDRDNFMSPLEALNYGIIDNILINNI